MSIIPINNSDRRIDLFDPFSLDLWDPFPDFPFPFPSLSRAFPDFNLGASVNSRVDWKETAYAYVLRATFPGEDVLVELQDDRVLQISTDSGSFMSRFKLPDNARIDQLKAFMNNGVLTVTVPKEGASRSNVRVVEITGED
ncbi:hypothetical protein L484_006028 [Morus notabilis]|uniref:SHSP domain-containing protein n=1 Tax=Morus notabilis TaxID=981085 RepID=W9QLJ6_9ROSA|nr:18.2 kDa class I heat shock protein [Morus notabilis]EXB30478.1 hypothetical protein L484_006028 [Morus notabilis]